MMKKDYRKIKNASFNYLYNITKKGKQVKT